MDKNIVTLFRDSTDEEQEKIRNHGAELIKESDGFILVYRASAGSSFRFMYSNMSDEDVIVVGSLLQAVGVKDFLSEDI